MGATVSKPTSKIMTTWAGATTYSTHPQHLPFKIKMTTKIRTTSREWQQLKIVTKTTGTLKGILLTRTHLSLATPSKEEEGKGQRFRSSPTN